jgi:hypothetical protein
MGQLLVSCWLWFGAAVQVLQHPYPGLSRLHRRARSDGSTRCPPPQ